MLRGFGSGKSMIRWKKLPTPGLCLETVVGRRPSRFLLILFFSMTANSSPTNFCNRYMISTDVMKQSLTSSRYMQETTVSVDRYCSWDMRSQETMRRCLSWTLQNRTSLRPAFISEGSQPWHSSARGVTKSRAARTSPVPTALVLFRAARALARL